MGWLCRFGNYGSVKEFANEMLSFGENHKVIDQSVSSKQVFTVVENEITGVRCISVAIVERGNGEWCIKHMDETCEPNAYDCPERILIQSNVMHPRAVEWREYCRKRRNDKKLALQMVESLKKGDVISLKGNKLEFRDFYYSPKTKKKSKSQIVCFSLSDNALFRYKINTFSLDELKPE